MFFLDAPLTLLNPGCALFLEFPRLPLLLRLTSLEGRVLLARTGGAGKGDAQGAELRTARPSPSREFAMPAGPGEATTTRLAAAPG